MDDGTALRRRPIQLEKVMTDQQLQHIEEFAGALMSPKEICVIMQLDWEQHRSRFIEPTDVIYQCYQRGKLRSIAVARQFVIKLANEGSSAAQQLMQEFITEVNTKEENELN